MAVRGRKKVEKRIKTGLAGVPLEKGYESSRFYFYEALDKKDYVPIIKQHVRNTYKPKDRDLILSNKEYEFNFFNYACIVHCVNAGLNVPDESKFALNRYLERLLDQGKKIKHEKMTVVVKSERKISPMERLKMKVDETVMQDIHDLEDKWIENEKTPALDLFNLFKQYDLKGAATNIVKDKLNVWFNDYKAAYEKTDDYIVESYSHLKKTELKRRMVECGKMISDLEKLSATRKAVRKPRATKQKPIQKQVENLKYKQMDPTYKIESINPALIVGASKMLCFNTKTRKLTMLVCESTTGLQVKNTTVCGFTEDKSFTITIRKPDDVMEELLANTPHKLTKLFDGIKAKKAPASGRTNNDTILLRVVK